jgi:diphthamide synthase (EF-2-diphthine--ammonia ligase)
MIDEAFLNDLPEGVDPCGEHGEFHTFCFDSPFFSHPVLFETGETVYREYDHNGVKSGFYFLDLLPADK